MSERWNLKIAFLISGSMTVKSLFSSKIALLMILSAITLSKLYDINPLSAS